MRLPLIAAVLLLAAGCGGGATTTADGDLRWGDGEYAVVLVHDTGLDADSWRLQARQVADLGTTVVAVSDSSPGAVAAAVERLHDDGHPRVALVGAGTGADAVLRLSSRQPRLADQLVLLSPTTTEQGGSQPRLVLASTDDRVADVARTVATRSAASDSLALLFPGTAHGQRIFTADSGALPVLLQRIAKRAG